MHRAQPVFNRLCVDKQLERNHVIHREKLYGIHSSSSARYSQTSYAPPQDFKLNHLKKEQMNESRFTEIERENRILLEKITHIMSKGANISSQPVSIQSSTQYPKQQQQQQQQLSSATPTLTNHADRSQSELSQHQQQQSPSSLTSSDQNNHSIIGRISPDSFATQTRSVLRPPPIKPSLNLVLRRKEENRMIDENSQFFQRLQSKKSHYSVTQWESDFQKNIDRAASISQYPFSLFPLVHNNNTNSSNTYNTINTSQKENPPYTFQNNTPTANPIESMYPHSKRNISDDSRLKPLSAVFKEHNDSFLQEDHFYYSATGNPSFNQRRQYRNNKQSPFNSAYNSQGNEDTLMSFSKANTPAMRTLDSRTNNALQSPERFRSNSSRQNSTTIPHRSARNTDSATKMNQIKSHRLHAMNEINESSFYNSSSSRQTSVETGSSRKLRIKKQIRVKSKPSCTAQKLFPLLATSVILYQEQRNISGTLFELYIREEEATMLILAEQVDNGDLKVIEIPKKEAIHFLKEECDGDPSSLALRLRVHNGKLYLIGTHQQSPTPSIPVGPDPSSLSEREKKHLSPQQNLAESKSSSPSAIQKEFKSAEKRKNSQDNSTEDPRDYINPPEKPSFKHSKQTLANKIVSPKTLSPINKKRL